MTGITLMLAAALAASPFSPCPGSAGASAGGGDVEFTDEFPLGDCKFKAKGGNRHWSLEPGYQLRLEGEDEGELIVVVITVLPQKRTVEFDWNGETIKVKTRVIEECESADGELTEISRNFYAVCRETHDVYYFGEEVDIYEDGEIVGHDGAWLAGVDGAMPGIIMPGSFLLGSRYFQEVAPGVALDRAEHVETGATMETPAGTFEDCVVVFEDSALEEGAESVKAYCPGVGLIQDDELRLVWFGFPDDDDDDDDDG